jgi:branched-chain amino acid transport system substrate-binding protein
MRRLLLILTSGLSTFGFGTGCAAMYHLDQYSTADDEKPSAKTPPSEVDSPPLEAGAEAVDAGQSCNVNLDCNRPVVGENGGTATTAAPSPAICLKSTGKCAPLTSLDCPRVYGDYLQDSAIVVGTLLGGGGEADVALEQSAVMAAEEIDSARAGGGLPRVSAQGSARPLVVVGCDASTNAVRAARHLVDDLHVPAIVGPTAADDVVDVTQQVSSKGGTLIITPTSPASSISKLADDDLTWRVVPSDTQRAKLVIGQMNDLEDVLRTTRSLTRVKLGVIHRTDALGLSARDSISGTLIINGRFINDAANAAYVSIDSYTNQPNLASPMSSIVSKYSSTFVPDLVFITAPEQVAGVIIPLEQAFTTARIVNRPYYVCTDAAKTQEFLDAVASARLPGDIRRRVRGIGVKPDTSSAPILDAFTASFTARYGAPPRTSGAALSYDAMYAVAFAIAATPDLPVSGPSVAHGLRALGVGDAFSVGPNQAAQVMQSLSTGTSVSLRGTESAMQWDPMGDIAGGTAEVWCIGTGAVPAFASGGLTMDVQTQIIGGAFVQCR